MAKSMRGSFSKKQSQEIFKKLKTHKRVLKRSDFKTGKYVFFSYNAKHKEFVYDKNPLVLVISTSKGYTLGINFHWLPISIRVRLINMVRKEEDLRKIMRYKSLRPCIRLYINKRISRQGISLSNEEVPIVARMRMESFTGGIPSETLYRMAIEKYMKSKAKKRNNRGRKK